MKCPKGTVEVSLWWKKPDDEDRSEYKSMYFDNIRSNTSGGGIIEAHHSDEGLEWERELALAVYDKLKPVLDLMTPRTDVSTVTCVYLFEPDEFEHLTEGIYREQFRSAFAESKDEKQ